MIFFKFEHYSNSAESAPPKYNPTFDHGHMARGSHELLKILLGPTMLDPSTSCRLATPETALQFFSAVACLQGRRPAAVFFPLEHPMPYIPMLLKYCELRWSLIAVPDRGVFQGIGMWHGVSKGVEDGRMPPAQQSSHP
jgi:hypothetical protein